jgi:hypothetical protein
LSAFLLFDKIPEKINLKEEKMLAHGFSLWLASFIAFGNMVRQNIMMVGVCGAKLFIEW